MNVDFFKEKFASKTNEALEAIAKNNVKYVLEARFAAVSIMRNREFSSPIIEAVEKENQFIKELEDDENQKIIQKLAAIKKIAKYPLYNGNEL